MSLCGITPDFIPSLYLKPLGNGTIVFLFLARSLNSEGLVRKSGQEESGTLTTKLEWRIKDRHKEGCMWAGFRR